jgi:hypothetical protein
VRETLPAALGIREVLFCCFADEERLRYEMLLRTESLA